MALWDAPWHVRRRHSWPHRALALAMFWDTAMVSPSSADIHLPRYLKESTCSRLVAPALSVGACVRVAIICCVRVRRVLRLHPALHNSLSLCLS